MATWYPATPELSVDADHLRVVPVPTPGYVPRNATTFAGTVGGWVSVATLYAHGFPSTRQLVGSSVVPTTTAVVVNLVPATIRPADRYVAVQWLVPDFRKLRPDHGSVTAPSGRSNSIRNSV